jgi:fatty acyl-CoA reductase
MNVRGVKRMIDLALKMKKLQVFVHVSTAYANCERQHIAEVVYNPPVQPEKILEACDWMEDDLVNLITPKLIKTRPNTYTFTKAIAESLVLQHQNDFPITIVRPSIVGATWLEPFPGWIENLNGPTALFVMSGKGLLKTMLAQRNAVADILPVDTCVNFLIAAGWYRGTNRTSDPMVFNCTTGRINPLRWSVAEDVVNKVIKHTPLENVFMYPSGHFTSSKYVKVVKTLFTQIIPSFLMDCFLRVVRKKPM